MVGDKEGARKPGILNEEDDVAFDHYDDHIVESDDNLEHHRIISQESDHGDDDFNM